MCSECRYINYFLISSNTNDVSMSDLAKFLNVCYILAAANFLIIYVLGLIVPVCYCSVDKAAYIQALFGTVPWISGVLIGPIWYCSLDKAAFLLALFGTVPWIKRRSYWPYLVLFLG